MESLFIPIIIALLFSIILSIVFKGKDKVDRGFAFNYYRLSYRRKFLRSLTTLPILILVVIIIYVFTDWSLLINILVGGILLMFYLVQLIYNYYMWQRNEDSV